MQNTVPQPTNKRPPRHPEETLTSRERVIRTLRREPVDRFPIDLGSHMSTGISMFAYRALRQHLGLDTDAILIPDVTQCLAYVDPDILERFHCDCILLEPPWPQQRQWTPRGENTFWVPARFKPEKQTNGDWIVHHGEQSMRLPANGFFFDGDWLNACWHGLNDEQVLERYRREAERLYHETPYAVNFLGYSYGLSFRPFFDGVDQGIRMLTAPHDVLAENEQLLQKIIKRFDRINEAFGPFIQLLSIGNDMGGQNGPLVNPKSIEQFCLPFYRKFFQHVHQNSDIRIFMHNCGGIEPLIPGLIESGVDVLNPVQISADGMDPQHLKTQYGDRLIFWGGGCDTQGVLTCSTPEQVKEHVRQLCRIFKVNGGFVFNQVHNIMGDVPPENIVAMLDTAYQESFYQPDQTDE